MERKVKYENNFEIKILFNLTENYITLHTYLPTNKIRIGYHKNKWMSEIGNT